MASLSPQSHLKRDDNASVKSGNNFGLLANDTSKSKSRSKEGNKRPAWALADSKQSMKNNFISIGKKEEVVQIKSKAQITDPSLNTKRKASSPRITTEAFFNKYQRY